MERQRFPSSRRKLNRTPETSARDETLLETPLLPAKLDETMTRAGSAEKIVVMTAMGITQIGAASSSNRYCVIF
jgi:hypothetical protein